ncbi:MAG: SRPBCC domain-containing protein [Pseudomonadota bacterium]
MSGLGELLLTRPGADTIELERRIPGSARLFWRLWTDPDHVRRWWGPGDAHTTACQIDLRVGGAWRIEFTSASYGDKVLEGTYTALDEPHRLSFTWAWEENGVAGHRSLVTVSFEDAGADCILRVHHSGLTSQQAESHPIGWRSGLEKFTEYALEQG